MAVDAAEDDEQQGFRPSVFGWLLIALADFAGAVGLGSLVLGDGGTAWLVGAAALLIAGLSTGG